MNVFLSPHRALSARLPTAAASIQGSGNLPHVTSSEPDELYQVVEDPRMGPQQGPASASSAAASASTAPPTIEMLRSLLAIPAGMVGSSGGRSAGRKGKGNKRPKLAREGQIVSKMFDAFGSRPQPTNGLSLEQMVTLEVSAMVPGIISSSATAGLITYGANSISLAAFSGTSSAITVFDQYRFEQIEAWYEFFAPNSPSLYPDLYTCVDLDDSNTPTAIGQIQDHAGALVAAGPGGHYHKWKPHMAIAAYSGAFTSYSNIPATWIDSASPNVQHYGLKQALVSGGAVFGVNLVLRAVISFRAPSVN